MSRLRVDNIYGIGGVGDINFPDSIRESSSSYVVNGSYTPTATGSTNVNSWGPSSVHYYQQFNSTQVIVFGHTFIAAQAAPSSAVHDIELPVTAASNLDQNSIFGIAYSSSNTGFGRFQAAIGGATNTMISLSFQAETTGGTTLKYMFSYNRASS